MRFFLLAASLYLISTVLHASNIIVNDITQLNPISVNKIISPTTIEDIRQAIVNTSGKISIGGGKYSQGGQTAYPNSLHIDMRQFNKIVHLNELKKEVSVQAGITWRKLQTEIDKYGLSISVMQTYADFTVGGSLSVNAHGRYIGRGAIVHTVKSIKLMLSDGSIVTANRSHNADLFYASIGGYGGIGVILEVTLLLDINTKIERKVSTMDIGEYKKYFMQNTRDDKSIIFHNSDIYPPDFVDVRAISWHTTDKDLTNTDRLRDKKDSYTFIPNLIDFLSLSDIGKWLRKNIIDPVYYYANAVVWRNWEASYDVTELEPKSRKEYTYALKEYFVPIDEFDNFYVSLRDILIKYNVNVVNISIRHAHKDQETILSWSRNEVFAFVVYYRQANDVKSQQIVKKWDQDIIDAVLESGGSYYLPYQNNATVDQFVKAYPKYKEYMLLKKKVDPHSRFFNKLLEKYLDKV